MLCCAIGKLCYNTPPSVTYLYQIRKTHYDERRNPSGAPSLHRDIRVLPRRRRKHGRHRNDGLAQAAPEQRDVAGSLDLHLARTYYLSTTSQSRPFHADGPSMPR